MQLDYWLQQQPGKPLFPDIEWQKPEQRALAGKLLIVGGSGSGFAAVAQAYTDALAAGAGECRVIMPDSLKAAVDRMVFDCLLVSSNHSGGISKDALPQLQAAAAWADAILLIGDTGRNSETAITLELLLKYVAKPLILTRDTIDLLAANAGQYLQQPNVTYVATFAQLQKLFQAVYYPKVILFSMSLLAIVEVLHKFTITYPVTVIVLHQGQLLVAHDGRVSSTPWANPMLIWRGSVAAKAAAYSMHHPSKPFEALTASVA